MRVSKRKGVQVYSPDDRDLKGFVKLLLDWVEEEGLPYRRVDVEDFCQTWPFCSNVNLRDKWEWLSQLYNFIHFEIRYN